MTSTAGTRFLGFEPLVALLASILERHGCPPAAAKPLAENCAAAERDGAHSHGLFRLKGYVSTLRSGWVDPTATPIVEDAAPGFLRIDCRNGFAVPALLAARDAAIVKARRAGVAVVALRHSHHLGALSLDVEPFAAEGLIALSFINSVRAVVPHGGHRAVFGTNPMAFATPRAKGPPLVFDMATSTMAHGDVMLAAREGRALPLGTGVDRHGHPTTDAGEVAEGGALLPFGGHKGAALSLMVEVLCAALVGAPFSEEVERARPPGAVTPGTGQSFILIDPQAGRGELSPFADRVETLLNYVRLAGQERLPGDRRLAARAKAARDGIAVSEALSDELAALAAA